MSMNRKKSILHKKNSIDKYKLSKKKIWRSND